MPIVLNFNPAAGNSITKYGDMLAQAMIRKAELEAEMRARRDAQFGEAFSRGVFQGNQIRADAEAQQRALTAQEQRQYQAQNFESIENARSRDAQTARDKTLHGYSMDELGAQQDFTLGRDYIGHQYDMERENTRGYWDAAQQDARDTNYLDRAERTAQTKEGIDREQFARKAGFGSWDAMTGLAESKGWSLENTIAMQPFRNRVAAEVRPRTEAEMDAAVEDMFQAAQDAKVPVTQVQYGLTPQGEAALAENEARRAKAMSTLPIQIQPNVAAEFRRREQEIRRNYSKWQAPPTPQQQVEQNAYTDEGGQTWTIKRDPKGNVIGVAPVAFNNTPQAAQIKAQVDAAKLISNAQKTWDSVRDRKTEHYMKPVGSGLTQTPGMSFNEAQKKATADTTANYGPRPGGDIEGAPQAAPEPSALAVPQWEGKKRIRVKGGPYDGATIEATWEDAKKIKEENPGTDFEVAGG